MMNTIMNLEYKLDLRYFLDRVLSFKRSLMLVVVEASKKSWIATAAIYKSCILLTIFCMCLPFFLAQSCFLFRFETFVLDDQAYLAMSKILEFLNFVICFIFATYCKNRSADLD